MEAFDSVIEEAWKPESRVEQSHALEAESMLAKQLKHEESSMESSSCQMATRWKCHQREIIAAHILVQMANEDSGLLRYGLNSHGVKHSMEGMLRMRWETRGGRIAGDSHSEVDRRKAKFLAKGQQAALGGQMNDGDSVVLALSAMPCPGRRKHRKMNIGMELSSLRPKYMNCNVSEDKGDNLFEECGVFDGDELTSRWGNNNQKSIEAGLEDPHDRLGMSRIKKRKTVAISCFSRETEDVQERFHHVGSHPAAPPLVLMEPTLNKRERFRGMKRKMNIATISPSSEEVRAHFRKEEALRYLVSDRGFCYTALDGRKSAVAPLTKMKKIARYHVILKPDRPCHIYTLCLVRDAAARLPGGVGTRADICTLMRDSQYLVEDISDEQLNQVASKGLDRLHYEVDPCVKYDGKLWVYLHRNRGEDDFEDDATSSAYVRRRYREALWSNASVHGRNLHIIQSRK